MDGAIRGASGSLGSAVRPHRFPKEVRLRKRREFLAVQKTGVRFHGRHFLAVVAVRASRQHNPVHGRVGITVSKKVGNAVARNRVKRLVREYMRRSSWLTSPWDCVIIAKRSAANLVGYAAASADLERIFRRVHAAAAEVEQAC